MNYEDKKYPTRQDMREEIDRLREENEDLKRELNRCDCGVCAWCCGTTYYQMKRKLAAAEARAEQMTIERDEAKRTGGYTCRICGALRMECEIMQRAADDARRETAEEIAQQMDAHFDEHRDTWRHTEACAIKTWADKIRARFGEG